LTQLPRPFPVSLRRLLVDNNNLIQLEADTFVARSELTSLSLAGNKIESVSPQALQYTLQLQSVDFSNNLLRSLHPDMFSTNSKLRALHLSKNPLVQLESGIFKNLSSLKALSLSYLSSPDLIVKDDLLKPLFNLNRLDADNSPTLVHSLINSNQFDSVRSLQDLGLANCDLRSLPSNWPVLSRLNQLRLSGNRWHCDESIKWFRDWLQKPDNVEKVDNRPQDIRCASPNSVQNRPLISLTDLQLSALPLPDDNAPTTTLPFLLSGGGSSSTNARQEVSETADKNYEIEDVEDHDVTMDIFAPDDDVIPEEDLNPDDDFVSKYQDEVPTTVTSRNRMTSSHVSIHISAAANNDEDQRSQRFKLLQLIIAVSTVGATAIVVTIIVAAIVYVCRRQRRPPANSPPQQPARTFIKYKNKNGVLYFSTPADTVDNCHEVDQCLTVGHVQSVADSTPDGTLHYIVPVVNSVPATPVTPVTPIGYKTRVYRWEDF
jgi:hypothetical protein